MRTGRERILGIFNGMKQRCYNKNSTKYHRYGGRGITICDEWLKNPQSFVDWSMDNGYADNLTIDRINNDGNYEPSNCRWATKKEQANNTSTNHRITYNGETHTLKEWSEKLGISYQTLMIRLCHGWSEEKTLSEPVNTSLTKRYDEVPHIPGESKEERGRRVKEYKRRQSGIRTEAQRRSDDKADVMAKAEIIRKAVQENPGISVRKLAKYTGIPKSTVQRILKTLY